MKDFCKDETRKVSQLRNELKLLGEMKSELDDKCVNLQKENADYKQFFVEQSKAIKTLKVRRILSEFPSFFLGNQSLQNNFSIIPRNQWN